MEKERKQIILDFWIDVHVEACICMHECAYASLPKNAQQAAHENYIYSKPRMILIVKAINLLYTDNN